MTAEIIEIFEKLSFIDANDIYLWIKHQLSNQFPIFCDYTQLQNSSAIYL